jgi:DNA-binding NarL/FixJ family response regulator
MILALLIEDLTVVRESLAMALATVKDIELHCCSSIAEGIDLLDESFRRFDVVLLKQRAGGQRADELLAVTNRNGLKDRVLIITPWLSDSEQGRLASLGVAGIFTERRSFVELIRAIRQVAGGQTWFDKQHSREDAPSGALSRQERRAAELVLEGLANKEIGVRMSVSESNIKALLQRAFLKLGVHSRGQLVRVLIEESIGAQPRFDGLMQFAPMGRPGLGEAAQSSL